MRLERLGGVAAIALLAMMGTASAVTFTVPTCSGCSITATVAPAGGSSLSLENFGSTAVKPASGFLSAAPITMGIETITFVNGVATGAPNPPSGLYTGTTTNIASSPFQPAPQTPPGPPQNYLVAQPGGSVNIAYAVPQNEFDLLWGSVDPDPNRNLVTVSIPGMGSVTGTQILAAIGGAAGVQNVDVRINTDGGMFGTVVLADAAGQLSAFEFVKGAIPEPASIAILGAALAGMGLLRRRKTA